MVVGRLKFKKILLLILAVGLTFLVLVSPKIFYLFRDLLNPNKIIVKTTEEFNIEELDIFWSVGQGTPIPVFSDGQELNVSFKEYGDNGFDIVYKGDTLLSFYYLKTNYWHGHRHIISLTRDSLTVEITGPDKKGTYKKKLWTTD